MRVTALGHSGLLVEASGERILIDPILRDAPFAQGLLEIDPPRRLRFERMPKPSALVITHAHGDHFDPRSLALLDRALPVALPPDPELKRRLSELGFHDLRELRANTGFSIELGRTRLAATPSGPRKSDELGVVVSTGEAALWNIADTEVDPQISRTLLREISSVEIVAARFQPIRRVLDSLTSNSGASFDKSDVVSWLEAACAVRPRVIFPYGAGLLLRGRSAWLNRQMFPFDEAEIVKLLAKRLGAAGTAHGMRPGDALEVVRGNVEHLPQSSAFVRSIGQARRPSWEPIDVKTFGSLRPSRRRELVKRLEALLRGPFAAWLRRELASARSALAGFSEWGVVWQLVVHLGTSRAEYSIDFGTKPRRLVRGRAASANYFFHCSGDALHRLLCRGGSVEWLLSAGEERFCERILAVRGGVVSAPPEVGPALYARLPDPLLVYLASSRDAASTRR